MIERTLINNSILKTAKNGITNETGKRMAKIDEKFTRIRNKKIHEIAQAFICFSPLVGGAVKAHVHDQELNYLPRY